MADWASTWPSASWAVTAKYGPLVFTVIVVSKPARRCEPALASAPAVVPARTVHVSSSVDPFQLAYTTELDTWTVRVLAQSATVRLEK